MKLLPGVRGAWSAVLALGLVGCSAVPKEQVVAVPAPMAHPADRVPSPAEAAKAQRVTADQIYTIYSRNLNFGANRDQMFFNRLLLVSGVYNGVNDGVPGRVYLELRTHDDGAFTYAELSEDARPLLASLAPGMKVRLLCRGDGMAGGSPLLRSCRGA